MTKTQKDALWRLISLGIVLFLFGYIIVSRVGFHTYYKQIVATQEQILANQKIIIGETLMLTNWTALDKTALCIMLAVAIWFIKFLVVLIKDMLIKQQPVAYDEEHDFIEESKRKMAEILKGINQQFEAYTIKLSGHDARIIHMEHTVDSLLKERCCPVHDETVAMIKDIRTDIKLNATKIDTLVATLETMKNIGAIHSHNK